MVVCVKINGRKRRICAGDLIHRIGIFDRELLGNVEKKLAYDTSFVGGESVSALILTRGGSQIIDGVSVTVRATHDFYIRYRADLDSQKWIIYNGVIYDIMEIENLEERNEFLRISCIKKGTNRAAGGNPATARFSIV